MQQETTTQVCKDCRNPFEISVEEVAFITSQKDEAGNPYTLPKRCKKCRAQKKKRYEDFEQKKREAESRKLAFRIMSGERVVLN